MFFWNNNGLIFFIFSIHTIEYSIELESIKWSSYFTKAWFYDYGG